ncbi:5-(carboxyamino)imidazole ribonucleotide mutase [Vagococcus silagei]|uniref:N5-carboxyaminoimidazole ribonucleotide mutase n=1 Tax=Vagococcus silagei TaxID=2508885 RepID=A0A4S3B8D7_9ENTE|nr:5-(carboxyamino)imidazole ribonucleotide mutase [Vagococcus silagei]THB62076.1 5-(carboxyamino)imidazole ribonucleotide mutase [Vagococcus silagei]
MSKVAVVMGSKSDWNTMQETCRLLDEFEIAYEKKILSAHRLPDLMFAFSENAKGNDFSVIIAGAGGAAHLPGMMASKTTLPVIGVPIASQHLNGLDSLLSIVQMPAGIPVATTAIGKAGAKNAALLAIQILAIQNEQLTEKLTNYRKNLASEVIQSETELL